MFLDAGGAGDLSGGPQLPVVLLPVLEGEGVYLAEALALGQVEGGGGVQAARQ